MCIRDREKDGKPYFAEKKKEEDDKDEDPTGTGVGAGFAINVIVNDRAEANVLSGRNISGNAGSLGVIAGSKTTFNTSAEAGTAPDEDSPGQVNALDAAVAVNIGIKNTNASIQSGTELQLLGSKGLTIKSNTSTDAKTTAKGDAVADKVAVGAAVGVSVVIDKASALLSRDATVAGDVAIGVKSESTDMVLADATAKGTFVQKIADKTGVLNQDLDSIIDGGTDKVNDLAASAKTKFGKVKVAGQTMSPTKTTSQRALSGDFSTAEGEDPVTAQVGDCLLYTSDAADE